MRRRPTARKLGSMAGTRPSRRMRPRGVAVAAAVVLAVGALQGAPGAVPAARADVGAAGTVDPAAARVFTLMGDGPLDTSADGARATDLAMIPDRVAATSDGGFVARVESRLVLRVTAQGRVSILPTGGRYIGDLAAGPNGDVYLVDEDAGMIMRVGADGRLVRFAGRRQQAWLDCRYDGDGGPAVDAHLCPSRITMSPSGLLVLELGSATVRRIGPDGIITRVAGNGRFGQPIAGASATAGPLDLDTSADIAVLPDGSPVLLTESGIWTIGPDAHVRLLMRLHLMADRSRAWFRTLMPLADGSVLTGGFRVGLLAAAGLRTLTTSPDCCGLWSAFDGDAAPLSASRWMQPLDFALDADGGWLIADIGHLRYVPPPTPGRLAVGLAAPTVSSRLPVTATVEATRPSRITVTLRIHGRRVGTRTVDRPAGRWRIQVPGGRAGVLNVVSVLVASDDQPPQVATDRIGVLPGDTLPMAVAWRLATGEAEYMRGIGGGNPTMTCRRIEGRRVDCADEDGGLCQRITAYRLRPDGILTDRDYEEGADRCVFKTHPRWPKEGPAGVELPT